MGEKIRECLNQDVLIFNKNLLLYFR